MPRLQTFVYQGKRKATLSNVLYEGRPIRVPLMAVNSADDLINPPELGILEREIKRVPKGRAVVVPLSPETQGHGTHTIAAVWENYLQELLSVSATPAYGKNQK